MLPVLKIGQTPWATVRAYPLGGDAKTEQRAIHIGKITHHLIQFGNLAIIEASGAHLLGSHFL